MVYNFGILGATVATLLAIEWPPVPSVNWASPDLQTITSVPLGPKAGTAIAECFRATVAAFLAAPSRHRG